MYLEKCLGSWLSFILYNFNNLLTSHLRWDMVFGVTCAPGLWPLMFGSRINYLLFPLRWETRFVSAGAPLGKWRVWRAPGGETSVLLREVAMAVATRWQHGGGFGICDWKWSPEFSLDKKNENWMPVLTDRLSHTTTESHVGEAHMVNA